MRDKQKHKDTLIHSKMKNKEQIRKEIQLPQLHTAEPNSPFPRRASRLSFLSSWARISHAWKTLDNHHARKIGRAQSKTSLTVLFISI